MVEELAEMYGPDCFTDETHHFILLKEQEAGEVMISIAKWTGERKRCDRTLSAPVKKSHNMCHYRSCDTMPTKDVQADPAPAHGAVAGKHMVLRRAGHMAILGLLRPQKSLSIVVVHEPQMETQDVCRGIA